MIQEEFVVRTETGELLGVFKKPAEKGIFPTIVFVQGFGMDYHEYKGSFDQIAEALIAKGFLTVQFNFSYAQYITDTETHELSLPKRAREMESVFDWLTTRPEIDKNHIGIIGQSFGVSTILFAQNLPVSSFCFVSGVGLRPETFIKRYMDKGAIINRTGQTRLPGTRAKTKIIESDFWPSFENFQQEDFVKKLKSPSFVVHGDTDSYISVSECQKVYDALENSRKKLKIYTGGDHGIIDVARPMREEFLNDVADWFTTTLISL